LKEWASSGRVFLVAFYRRRALRLLPALLTALFVYVTVSAALTSSGRLISDELHESVLGSVYGLFYAYNIAAGYFDFSAYGLDRLWTLAAEEQFYLLWPPVLAIALHRRFRPRLLVASVCALAIAFASWRVILVLNGAWGARIHAPDAHADPLLIGCVAGLLYSLGFVRRVPLAVASGFLFFATFTFVALREVTSAHNILGLPLFCLAVGVILLAAVLHPEWWFTRLIDRRALRFGTISYGLYIWHGLVYVFLGAGSTTRNAIAIPLSVLVAALSYRYIEQPFLRRRHVTIQRDQQPTLSAESVPA
jgi:peptidoglycan/LPS O-acetylase OafA/YrhL